MPRKTLRAATEADAKAAADAAVVPKTLKAATELSERALLVKMRMTIAEEIDRGVPPHTLAPLSRQLFAVDKEIRALDHRATEEAAESGHVAADEAWDAEAL